MTQKEKALFFLFCLGCTLLAANAGSTHLLNSVTFSSPGNSVTTIPSNIVNTSTLSTSLTTTSTVPTTMSTVIPFDFSMSFIRTNTSLTSSACPPYSSECAGEFDGTISLTSGSTQPVTLTVSGCPASAHYCGITSATTVNPTNMIAFDYAWTTAPAPGNYFITITGTGGGVTHSVTLQIFVFQPATSTLSTSSISTSTTVATTSISPNSIKYRLTVGVSPAGSGFVNPASETYSANAIVYIMATPIPGNAFLSWSGTGIGSYSGSNSFNPVIMYGNITETAQFVKSSNSITTTSIATSTTASTTATTSSSTSTTTIPANSIFYHLITWVIPSGYGTVLPNSGNYAVNSIVWINATAARNYTFIGWNGLGPGNYTGNYASANVAIHGNITEIAQFIRSQTSITTTTSVTTTLQTTTLSTSVTTVPATTAPTTTIAAPPSSVTFTLHLHPGWNLLSVPLLYSSEVNTTCNSEIQSPVWQLQSGQFIRAYNTEGGNGYWLKLSDSCSVTFAGQPLTSAQLPSLSVGWNLIGALNYSAPFNSIAGNCRAVSGPMSFDPSSGTYYNTSTISPGKGYFVKVASACSMGNAPPPLPS